MQHEISPAQVPLAFCKAGRVLPLNLAGNAPAALQGAYRLQTGASGDKLCDSDRQCETDQLFTL